MQPSRPPPPTTLQPSRDINAEDPTETSTESLGSPEISTEPERDRGFYLPPKPVTGFEVSKSPLPVPDFNPRNILNVVYQIPELKDICIQNECSLVKA